MYNKSGGFLSADALGFNLHPETDVDDFIDAQEFKRNAEREFEDPLADQDDIPLPIPAAKRDEEEHALTQISADAFQIQANARGSLDFLAALAMPDVYKYVFPHVFLGIWQWLSEFAHKVRDFSQLAIGLPRGFSKTTVLKLFVLYCILFTKKTFILYISGTQSKANDVIGDIADMLDEPNIKAVFGDWRIGLQIDRADFKMFGFRGRTIILRGAGAGSDIRGITRKNRRPDLMIFDDVQTREAADSEVLSSQLENWMQGTAMKAKSPEGCMFVFLANMYPTPYSLLKKLRNNPNWKKFITGAITEDGQSLWEELHPIAQLLREYQNDAAAGKAQIFFAEVLNDGDAQVNNTFDLTKVPEYAVHPNEPHQGNFVVIDPATDKIGSDLVTIQYCEVYNGVPVAKHITEGRFSPGDTITTALRYCLMHGCRVVGIESNAYQYSLNYWFSFLCQQYGIIGIQSVELYSTGMSKNARIGEMLKAYLKGEIQVHPQARPQVHNQITAFNPLRRDNTDGILDCLTFMPKMLAEYPHLIAGSTIMEEQEYADIRVYSELENSPF